ncbi:MAG TPA: GNAT family N-acetyltransferase, partial [Microthrixaceae bacterium]|nr:GNAT family N-acetyltransferase [Microthrixaceae bacterium]
MSAANVVVSELTEVEPDTVTALARLIPQLSTSAPPLTAEAVDEMVRSDASRVLVARGDGGEILGSLTLVIFRIPTGVRAWIEDVVVDEAARGLGVGEALNRHALELAHAAGARSVDL